MSKTSPSNRTDVLGFIIERTSKRLKQSLQRLLKEANAGITVDQWVLLHKIEQHTGVSQLEIAQYTFKDAPTVTRIIDLLVQKELVKRIEDEQDRRRFNIFLTKKGQAKVKEVYPIVLNFRKLSWQNLSANQKDQLIEMLDTIFDNLSSLK